MRFFYTLFLSLCAGHLLAQLTSGTDVKVTHEKLISTKGYDFSPNFWQDGVVFVSDRDAGKLNKKDTKRSGKNTFSVWQAKRVAGGSLDSASLFSKVINSKMNEGPLSFNATQDMVFFCRNNMSPTGNIIKDKKDIARMNIFYATRKGDEWSDVKGFDFTTTEADFMHPSISPDGTKLYFASNMGGNMDLYVTELKDGRWSAPMSLGPNINTNKTEAFPFVHADGTLFFASDGHKPSNGKLDIWYAHAKNGLFGKPKNLGAPINSKNDDFGLVVDLSKKIGYLSSDRTGGLGSDDIYSFVAKTKIGEPAEDELPPVSVCATDRATGKPLAGVKIEYYRMADLVSNSLVTDVAGKVVSGTSEAGGVQPQTGETDATGCLPFNIKADKYLFNLSKPGYKTEQLVRDMEPGSQALVPMDVSTGSSPFKGKVVNEVTKKPLGGVKVIFTDDNTGEIIQLTTNPDGEFATDLACGQSYTMSVEKDGFTQYKKNISNDKCQPTDLTEPIAILSLAEGLGEGVVIQLPNIFYNFNDASIRNDAAGDLDALAMLLGMYTDMEIELSSHTDARGSDAYNLDLSQRRAESAKQYLINRGIRPSRIVAKGYGESKPRSDCKGENCSEAAHQLNRRTECKVLKAPKNVEVGYLDNQPKVIDPMPGREGSISSGGSGSGREGGKVFVAAPEGNEFLVIAGTFANVENAEKRLIEVNKFGLSEAEIIHYTNKPLHAVCIKRFSDYYAAQAYAREQAGLHKLDLFVRSANF